MVGHKPSNLESQTIRARRPDLETIKRKLVADTTTTTSATMKRSSMDSVRVIVNEERQDVDTEWPRMTS